MERGNPARELCHQGLQGLQAQASLSGGTSCGKMCCSFCFSVKLFVRHSHSTKQAGRQGGMLPAQDSPNETVLSLVSALGRYIFSCDITRERVWRVSPVGLPCFAAYRVFSLRVSVFSFVNRDAVSPICRDLQGWRQCGRLPPATILGTQ